MQFEPPLESGRLLQRYKRFLADVALANGEQITIHCPNTGSMKNCLFPGEQVWFSRSDNPKRKYACTWELMQTPTGDLIGINTGRANQLAEEAINAGIITELLGYQQLKREVCYGVERSRIDIHLTQGVEADCFVEVKSATLLEGDRGYFPDAVTQRGQKHLRELMQVVKNGQRAVLLFIVQHTGIKNVAAAAHIDKDYADLLNEAIAAGVEVLAYRSELNCNEFKVTQAVPFIR
ncbi:DNA/RNA nuclease SfsA [Shewanella sp. C32]|uniref:Sugar fermentation stimulation protein homolog n=1 Tax=Shewanella electrica TaxID=515560 RepID=A0ABT2FPK2_9GAMM|nr:DNA/RNA nuclease SfsA [Shewanella electrica]MCH1926644.1 DNA/RNA nuclease SfsA [Shewanella electrica]MCS4558265.1 DNA/RNA nuclease SfsA [Shewanella electrica]